MTQWQNLPPIHHTLGGQVLAWDAAQQRLAVQYEALPAYVNPRGQVQGGMLAAMLDDGMGVLAMLASAPAAATSINLTLDFFKPCVPGQVLVKCRLKKQGSRVLHLEAEAWQGETLVARSTANFLLLPVAS
ncbi:MAG: PaaI family thioesterase [Neisseriaceae bacterium]|nr:PaaI family thioesterase [Neisseriaceae bacterium]MBP6862237.1 PaaI family thioesterase [Neisseriaceae bacterium]